MYEIDIVEETKITNREEKILRLIEENKVEEVAQI